MPDLYFEMLTFLLPLNVLNLMLFKSLSGQKELKQQAYRMRKN